MERRGAGLAHYVALEQADMPLTALQTQLYTLRSCVQALADRSTAERGVYALQVAYLICLWSMPLATC